MKYSNSLIILLILLATIDITGCKKKTCYHCYYFIGAFIATKNGDTANIGIMTTSARFHDSINSYISLGYHVDSVRGYYLADPSSGVEVCDTNSVYSGQDIRDSCALTKI